MNAIYEVKGEAIDGRYELDQQRSVMEKRLKVISAALSYHGFVRRQTSASSTMVGSDLDAGVEWAGSGKPVVMEPPAASQALEAVR